MPMLNRKVDYALLTLCYLHHKTVGASAREIAERFRLSRPFIANILKDLCQREYVISQRGVNGGYVLRSDIGQRSLADLIEALDDTLLLVECNAEPAEGCCDLMSHCPIREPIADVHRRIRELFDSVKLADLFLQSTKERTIQLDLSRI